MTFFTRAAWVLGLGAFGVALLAIADRCFASFEDFMRPGGMHPK